MSELDHIYQEFYAQVTAKIWAEYEVFKKEKPYLIHEEQIRQFKESIKKSILSIKDFPELNPLRTGPIGEEGIMYGFLGHFRDERKKYRYNAIFHYFKEHEKKLLEVFPTFESTQALKEIITKFFASKDALNDFIKDTKIDTLDQKNSLTTMSAKQTLRQWLANGENDRVVEALQTIADQFGDKYFRSNVTSIAGRFNGIKRDRQNGVISDEFYNIQINQIRQALQDLIEDVPDNATLPDVALDTPIPTPLGNEGNGTPTQPQTPPSEDGNKQPADTNANIPWIIGLGLLILATLLAAVIPCPAESLSLASRILLSLGAAGIATILPGLFSIDVQGVKAGSAIGVFALVYLVNPAKAIENNNCAPQFTSVTVFVHGKDGRQDMILRQQGFVLLDVSNERRRASINENGQAFFQNLRVGDTVQLNVDFSEPYKATRPNAKYVIENQGSIYLETALQGLDKVFGTVLDGDNPIADVLVSIGALRDTTDETGYFEIRVPENLQQQQQEVKFTKRGYKMTTKTAYPQTNAPLNVVLSK